MVDTPPTLVQQELGPPWVGSVHQRLQIDLQWLTAALAMLAVGVGFFGWRGAGGVLSTAGATMGVHLALVGLRRLVSKTPSRVAHLHALNLGLLLGLSAPMMAGPIVPLAAGALLGGVAHLMGRAHRLRLHPIAVVLVIVWLILPLMETWPIFSSQPTSFAQVGSVLRPERMVIGDVRRTTAEPSIVPWWSPAEYQVPDGLKRKDAGKLLLHHRIDLLLDREKLIRLISSGELVRLEELFIGAHPDAIGASSRALVLFLGFYLMYRRLAYWQVAATATLTALAALLIMPVWDSDGYVPVLARLIALGPAAALTYVSYFLFATPMALVVMILAPGATPMSRAGRMIYGMLIGGGAIALMWWIPAPQSAFLALVVASLLSRPLDGLQRSVFV